MELIRIDHVSLDVRDRPASVAWYAEVLGLHAGDLRVAPDAPVFVGPAGAQLGLFAERAPGLRHVALATSGSEQECLAARLERLGVRYRREHRRAGDSLYFADLDGTTLEVLGRDG